MRIASYSVTPDASDRYARFNKMSDPDYDAYLDEQAAHAEYDAIRSFTAEVEYQIQVATSYPQNTPQVQAAKQFLAKYEVQI